MRLTSARIRVVFQNWLPLLKIYSAHNVNYRFLALTVNFGTERVSLKRSVEFKFKCTVARDARVTRYFPRAMPLPPLLARARQKVNDCIPTRFQEAGGWLHFRIFTPSLLDSHLQRLAWAYLIACYLFSIYRVRCTLSLLKNRFKWKSTCSFSGLDYPLKRDGVESGEGSVAGHERKRAAFSSSSS